MIIQPCVLDLWRGWWAIDFQVPERPFFMFCTHRAQSLYLATVFPPSIHKFFIHPFYFYFTEALTSFLQQLFAFILRLSFVLQGKSYFDFLLLVFISHTTRISNKPSFLCKRLVVKNKLSNNLSRFSNWNVLHWTFKARGFNLEIILDSGKDLLLKTWL